jgi:predicted amidohydrolase YtcJ
MLIRSAELDGERVLDVRVCEGRVVAIGRLTREAGEEVVEAGGGALLPGLHDHHVHLLATAAAAASVPCGPPDCRDADELARRLRSAVTKTVSAWVRGVGYHESVAGPLDRDGLDRLAGPDGRRVPIRVQHRGGALWMLNSAALELVLPHLTGDERGVERDAAGRPTGRLWRRDDAVRAAGSATDEGAGLTGLTGLTGLAELGRRMRAFGLTGATDATPDPGEDAVRRLTAAVRSGDLPARLTLLGPPSLDAATEAAGLVLGPRKLLLHDHDLPTPDELTARIAREHEAGRPVAVHCVTRVSLVITLAALQAAGSRPGDRIEHAAVVPPELRGWMAGLGVAVVTQPALPAERGDDYLRDVDPADLPYLYPYAGLLAAGIRVAPSSDAPYAVLDPWAAMAAAASRRSPTGARVGDDVPVPARTVLAGYLSPAADPGGPPRRITVGGPADLCLLRVPLARAMAAPSAGLVASVLEATAR